MSNPPDRSRSVRRSPRSPEQRGVDRQAIMDHVHSEIAAYPGLSYVPSKPWMRPQDIEDLVNEGSLERRVSTVRSRQRGAAGNMFGGAGVVSHKRVDLSLPDRPDD